MLKHRRNRVAPPPPTCALSLCLRYLSGTWTPNILWYLGAQSRRFSELRRDMTGISAKVLAARLRRMQADGLVCRVELPSSPPSVEYSLTELGRELQPALAALVTVGEKIKSNGTQALAEISPRALAVVDRAIASRSTE